MKLSEEIRNWIAQVIIPMVTLWLTYRAGRERGRNDNQE